MEARLTELLSDTAVARRAGLREPGVAHSPAADRLPAGRADDRTAPQTRLLISIDRYLRAAGAKDPALRGRLMAATARDLLAQGQIADPSWAEIIAAIDRSLASELAPEGKTLPRARGRVALGLGGGSPAASDAVSGPDWGTPPRRLQAMQPQDLSLWRPRADALLRLRVSRSTQALTSCLCWLAVLLVP